MSEGLKSYPGFSLCLGYDFEQILLLGFCFLLPDMERLSGNKTFALLPDTLITLVTISSLVLAMVHFPGFGTKPIAH